MCVAGEGSHNGNVLNNDTECWIGDNDTSYNNAGSWLSWLL